MSKKLDWSAIASVNFDDKRRKSTPGGFSSGKEMFAKAHEQLLKAEAALADRKEQEPILKQALLNCMLSKAVLTVMMPISNPTESLGGLTKSEEDDGFYYKAPSGGSTEGAKFEEVMEIIPPGTQLTFKAFDRQLDQYIFKSDKGQEYSIYTKPCIIYKGNAIENPGLFGLLYNTDLINVLGEFL